MDDVYNWESTFELCYYSSRLLDKLLSLNTVVNRLLDIQLVKKAIYYAKKYHGDQRRHQESHITLIH